MSRPRRAHLPRPSRQARAGAGPSLAPEGLEALLRNAERYRAGRRAGAGALPAAPARRVAVVTCMDARLDPHRLLGLSEGEAHVIRNAGGLVSNDVIRSLALSQRALGTRTILVIGHTDCGALKVPDADFRAALREETGVEPPWDLRTAPDVRQQVLRSVERLAESPFLPYSEAIHGFVFDVHDGSLREVH